MPVTINASTSAGLVQTADTSGTLDLQANGTTVLSATPTGVAVTGTITATGGFPGITSGQIQTQLFTGPSTWTCPSSTTQVKVTVVGGGGGAYSNGYGSPGGTSSFGSLVSATGGAAVGPSNTQGAPGSGTVSVGTALKTGDVKLSQPGNQLVFMGILMGLNGKTAPGGAITYSTTSTMMAGANSAGTAPITASSGAGGFAIAMCPVSSPQPITVGAAGPGGPAGNGGGTSGAVVVEWVG